MILVLLILLILYFLYKKHYQNYKMVHASIAIWSLIAITIIIFKPFINHNTKIVSIEEKIFPIENNLDETEGFYLITDENKIYYKTNKIKSVNIGDSTIINYDSKQNKIIKYYKQNSTLWYLLTFNKKTNVIKTEFYIN